MKTTRRGFFGGMAGVAVAGPSLVKQAAAEAMSGASSGAFSQSGRIGGSYANTLDGQAIGQSARHLDYLRTRIQQLRGMTADERRDEVQNMGWDFDLAEVATLRSVSDRQKMRMLAERRIERNRERELSQLVRELMGLEGRA